MQAPGAAACRADKGGRYGSICSLLTLDVKLITAPNVTYIRTCNSKTWNARILRNP